MHRDTRRNLNAGGETGAIVTTGPTTEDRGLLLTIDDESADGIAGSVYRELRAAICDFRLEPNQRLVQNNLADQLGISRTPVRDALMRLAQEGLVHPAPQRGGYLVSEFTAREVLDIYDVRLALEPLAASQAAGHHTAVEIAMLRELNSAIAAQAEAPRDDTFELNREFHGLVISRSENVIIRRMLDQLWSMPSALRMYNLQMVADHDPESMVSEHEQIIIALETGDGARVANDVRSHITKARAEAVEHVEQSGL